MVFNVVLVNIVIVLSHFSQYLLFLYCNFFQRFILFDDFILLTISITTTTTLYPPRSGHFPVLRTVSPGAGAVGAALRRLRGGAGEAAPQGARRTARRGPLEGLA
jgi:hypothetical protein